MLQEADVIVVGAGMSGITAATTLKRMSPECSILVLEARDRIGGRIHTISSERMGKIDMGASWIHGNSRKNPIAQLAKQVSAENPDACKLFNTRWGRMKSYNVANGSVIPGRRAWGTHPVFERKIKKIQDIFEDESHDISLQEAIEKASPEMLEDALMDLHLAFLESSFGGAISELSTWWYDSDEEYSGHDAMVTTGYKDMCEYLARGLDIRMGVDVKRIQYDRKSLGDGVEIETSKGLFSARHCVVAVPLGVLKANSISFSPQLPPAKLKAIETTGFGAIAKVVLVFENAFWPRDVDVFAAVRSDFPSEDRGKFRMFVNMLTATGKPVLVAFCSGDYVKTMATLSKAEIVLEAMKTVRSMFVETDCPEPVESHVTEWSSDPHSRGTYSFHATGQKKFVWDDLVEPVDDVLFFAGEHCSKKYRGTVHGAFLAGEAAAKRIHKLMR